MANWYQLSRKIKLKDFNQYRVAAITEKRNRQMPEGVNMATQIFMNYFNKLLKKSNLGW